MLFIIRLDDACEYADVEKWERMERLLDRYHVRPIVGIIPACEDPGMKDAFPYDAGFWDKAAGWARKNWTVALHGYHHRYVTSCGGDNPVHRRSEFAGVPLEEQKEMIREGVKILRGHGLEPTVFFAPGHTFDRSTLEALKSESDIRTVSDTVASDVYFEDGIRFVPQQSGKARRLPVRLATFCFHPNTMGDRAFGELETFLRKNASKAADFAALRTAGGKKTPYGRLLSFGYFLLRRIRGTN